MPETSDPRRCTIVVPAHNAERYVAAAVDSALGQTYSPVEVVVVDDGSTDGTPTVLGRYADQPRVHVLRTDNRGPAAARNLGVTKSAGEFVAFLDADDVWSPERVARCIEMLDQDPTLTWVTTDLYVMDGDTVTDRRWYDDGTKASFAGSQLQHIARRNFVANGGVIRREWFERAGGFDEAIRGAEDYDLWIRLILAGGRVGLVDEPLGCYRLHHSSLTARGDAQWQSHLDALERNLGTLLARGASARSVDAIGVARRHAARGDRLGAARFVAYAARDGELSLVRQGAMWLRVPMTLVAGRV